MGASLGLAQIDTTTMKASINTDPWKKVAGLLKDIYSIPGNETPAIAGGAWELFIKERRVAMYSAVNNYLNHLKDAGDLEWDIAQYPSFREAPNIGSQIDMWVLHITEQSKYKDEAFMAIASILSPEVQMEMSRNARFPMIEDPTVQNEFAKNVPHLQGKNLGAAFLSQPAPAVPVTKFDGKAQSLMQRVVTEIASGEKDINTALRDAEEELNQHIAENQ